MTQVKTQVNPSTVIDARGPRFSAAITTAVLATALATSNLWVIVAQAIVLQSVPFVVHSSLPMR